MSKKLSPSGTAWVQKTVTLHRVASPLVPEFGPRAPDHISEVIDEIASRNPSLVHDVDRAVTLGLVDEARDALGVAIADFLDAEPEWRYGAPTSEDLCALEIADRWGGKLNSEQFAYVRNNAQAAYVPEKRAWFRRLLRARRERGQPLPTIVICGGPDGSERGVRLARVSYQVTGRADRHMPEPA